jgi:hypothetical protein
MEEEAIRRNIRNLLIESLGEVHLMLNKKYVPAESKECYDDLLNRISDAEAQRNGCARGTASRMHYNGLLSILRQKAKKHPLHAVVSESNRISLNEAGLFSTFVQPLTDVFETSKMAALQSLSSLWMVFRSLITFDPAKLKDLADAHDKRVQTVEKRYADVLKRTNDTLTSPDATVAFMLFAPNLWSSIYTKEWTAEKIDNITNAYKYVDSDSSPDKKNKKNDTVKIKKSIENNYMTFKQLFESNFKKSNSIDNVLLREDRKEKDKLQKLISSKEFIEANEEMREIFTAGLMASLKPLNEEFYRLDAIFNENSSFGNQLMKTETIQDLKELISEIETTNQNIFNFENLKEKLIESLEKAELEIKKLANPNEETGKSFSTLLKAQIFKSSEGFKKDKELSSEDIEKIKNTELNQKDARDVAEKQILKDVKKGFFTEGKKQLESIKQTVAETIVKKFPFLKDDKAVQAIEVNSKELGELIKGTVKILGIS